MGQGIIAILVFLFSLSVLFVSRYCFIQSSGNILRRLKLSDMGVIFTCAVLNFVIVEAFLAVSSVIYGEKTIALGILLGAVIANAGLVMGLASLLKAFPVENDIFRREVPAMFVALAAVYFLGHDFELSRLDGLILILLFAAFLFLNFKDDKFTGIDETAARPGRLAKRLNWQWACGILAVAVGGFIWGTYLLFKSTPQVADFFNLHKWAAALIIFGSFFALGRVFVPLFQVRKDFASAASLLTANICTILFGIGLIALIEPIYLSPSVIKFEIPAIALFSAAILAVVRSGKRISRQQGVLMLAGYVVFVVILLFHFD